MKNGLPNPGGLIINSKSTWNMPETLDDMLMYSHWKKKKKRALKRCKKKSRQKSSFKISPVKNSAERVYSKRIVNLNASKTLVYFKCWPQKVVFKSFHKFVKCCSRPLSGLGHVLKWHAVSNTIWPNFILKSEENKCVFRKYLKFFEGSEVLTELI